MRLLPKMPDDKSCLPRIGKRDRDRRGRIHQSGHLDLRGFLGMDDRVRNRYQQIQVKFKIKAPGVPEETLKELVEIAQKRSPVFDIVSHPTSVCVSLA